MYFATREPPNLLNINKLYLAFSKTFHVKKVILKCTCMKQKEVFF